MREIVEVYGICATVMFTIMAIDLIVLYQGGGFDPE